MYSQHGISTQSSEEQSQLNCLKLWLLWGISEWYAHGTCLQDSVYGYHATVVHSDGITTRGCNNHTHNNTHSTLDQGPSRDHNGHSSCQQIHHLLWTWQSVSTTHESDPHIHTPVLQDPFHTIFPPSLPRGTFISGFPFKILNTFLVSPMSVTSSRKWTPDVEGRFLNKQLMTSYKGVAFQLGCSVQL